MDIRVAAKVNLSLRIVGVNPEGMHELDSLMASAGIFDELSITRADGITVRFSGEYADGLDGVNNTAYRAAELFAKKFAFNGADIKIVKNIPLSAGLGGSSADAAGVLRGLACMNGVSESSPVLRMLARRCGSDVPFMLSGGFKRVTGTGEKLEPYGSAELFLIILPEKNGVGARDCYRAYDTLAATSGVRAYDPRGNDKLLAALTYRKPVGGLLHNDLYLPACTLNPQIARNLALLRSVTGDAVMTGSGSACIAVFYDSASRDAAHRELLARGVTGLIKTETV
ncbi:MAG: hypothetical protein LBS99_02735 [Clostridiales bacterium]|jgi:4-diphosphocytidyl-2-C-methyl-D-erythritol kinase|nr:hypothetical protein [Clostridiales bacterium]